MPVRKRKAAFVEPMLLLRAENLPEGDAWQYELKFDGYRALAIKTGGKIHLRSRNDNDFSLRYPAIARALSSLPNETVVDGAADVRGNGVIGAKGFWRHAVIVIGQAQPQNRNT